MYAAHFATGLAIKAAERRAPLFGLLIATGWLDLLFGVFLIFGVEGGNYAYFNMPWSHSLLMSVIWAVLFGALYYPMGLRVSVAMAIAVLSHIALDLGSHYRDIELWPYSSVKLGFAPFFGGLGGWLECSVCILGVVAYVVRMRQEQSRLRLAGIAVTIGALYLAELAVVRAPH